MRGGTVVYKYDAGGELKHTYTSFVKAYKGERVGFQALKFAIDTGQPLNGHTFSTGRRCTLTPREKPAARKGYFNIESWKSICF